MTSSALRDLRTALERLVTRLDADVLDAERAAALVDDFAAMERLCAAGKALAARRACEGRQWQRSGARSAAHWMAERTGTSVPAAAAVLETADRLRELPALDAAYRAGTLSEPQVKEIASAAAAVPEAAAMLVATAQHDTLRGLQQRCREVRATAPGGDAEARYRRIHRERSLRTWTDSEGVGCLMFRSTPDALADVLAGLGPFERAVFEAARSSGQREPYEAYAADALVAMARAAGADGDRGTKGPPAVVEVVISLEALRRGSAHPGERCEIAGVGPVPVATARAYLGDCLLQAIVSDGVDVYNVTHLGRHPTAHQRSALLARDAECIVPGCHVRHRLEIDHGTGWCVTRTTELADLARLCAFHHRQKTVDGYRWEGGPGRRRWLGPGGRLVSEDRPP
jgi:hypothetical protein